MNTKYYRLEMNNDTKEVSAFDVTADIETLKERANKLTIDDDLVASYINTTENPYSVLAKVENEYLVTYCKDNNELHKYVLEHTTAREMLDQIETEYIAEYLSNQDYYYTDRVLEGFGKENVINYIKENYDVSDIVEDFDTDDILNELSDRSVLDYAINNNSESDILDEVSTDGILNYVEENIETYQVLKNYGNQALLEYLYENDSNLMSKIKEDFDMETFLDAYSTAEIVEYLKNTRDLTDVVTWKIY